MKIVRTAKPPNQTLLDISAPGAFVFAVFTADSPSKLSAQNKIDMPPPFGKSLARDGSEDGTLSGMNEPPLKHGARPGIAGRFGSMCSLDVRISALPTRKTAPGQL